MWFTVRARAAATPFYDERLYVVGGSENFAGYLGDVWRSADGVSWAPVPVSGAGCRGGFIIRWFLMAGAFGCLGATGAVCGGRRMGAIGWRCRLPGIWGGIFIRWFCMRGAFGWWGG